MSEADAERARAFAGALSEQIAGFLCPSFIGSYLIGSLAHGGFSRYSDIDLAVVSEDGLSQAEIERIHSEAAELDRELAPLLSLFWTDRNFSVGRFPPLDRIDYLDHAVPLQVREQVRPERPTLDEVRTYLAGTPFAKWCERAAALAALDALPPAQDKSYIRALLYPARFIYSWETGGVASNDDAVEFVRTHHSADVNVPILEAALKCRAGEVTPQALFPARGLLLAQIAECRRLALQHGGQ